MKLLLLVAAIVFATVADLLFGNGEYVRAFLTWTHHTTYAISDWFDRLI